MQHDSTNKSSCGSRPVSFPVCSANFRVCSFREFPRLFLAHLYSKHFTMSQFTHKQGCKSMPGCSKPLTTQSIQGECKPQCPITRFCGGMYHGVVTLATILAICSLASWRPKRANKQTMLNVHKIYDDFQKNIVSENVSKNVFVWNNIVFQTNTKNVHTYG